MLMVNEVLISIELLWGTNEKEKHSHRKKPEMRKGVARIQWITGKTNTQYTQLQEMINYAQELPELPLSMIYCNLIVAHYAVDLGFAFEWHFWAWKLPNKIEQDWTDIKAAGENFYFSCGRRRNKSKLSYQRNLKDPQELLGSSPNDEKWWL